MKTKEYLAESIVLGYGPTTKKSCQACFKHAAGALTTGHAYHCYNPKTKERFVAGPYCRKTKIDPRSHSHFPVFGTFSEEEAGNTDDKIPQNDSITKKKQKPLKTESSRITASEKMIKEMSEWVQLRQYYLPTLGFNQTESLFLRPYMEDILNNNFDYFSAKQVKKIYDQDRVINPQLELEHLKDCFSAALLLRNALTQQNHPQICIDFLKSIQTQLLDRMSLTPKQKNGFNNWMKRRKLPLMKL